MLLKLLHQILSSQMFWDFFFFFFAVTRVGNKNNNKWGWVEFNVRCNSKRSAQLFLAMAFLVRAILCSTKKSWSNLWNKSSFLLIQRPVICWKKSHSDLTDKVHFGACLSCSITAAHAPIVSPSFASVWFMTGWICCLQSVAVPYGGVTCYTRSM